jgi:hypothetical protein
MSSVGLSVTDNLLRPQSVARAWNLGLPLFGGKDGSVAC